MMHRFATLAITTMIIVIPGPAIAAPWLSEWHDVSAADLLEGRGFPLTQSGLEDAMNSGDAFERMLAMEAAFYEDMSFITDEVEALIDSDWTDGEPPEDSVRWHIYNLALRYLAGQGDAQSLDRLDQIADKDEIELESRVMAAEFLAEAAGDFSRVTVLTHAIQLGDIVACGAATRALREFPPDMGAQNIVAWIDATGAAIDAVESEGLNLESRTKSHASHLIRSARLLEVAPQALFDKFVALAVTGNPYVGERLTPELLAELQTRIPPPTG